MRTDANNLCLFLTEFYDSKETSVGVESGANVINHFFMLIVILPLFYLFFKWANPGLFLIFIFVFSNTQYNFYIK